jgi:putative ABC transport system permease protein
MLDRFIGTSYREELLGDLEEMYEDRRSNRGKFIADIMYIVDAVHLLIGFSSTQHQNKHTMYMGNMFRIAWRNAIRHKQFTFLNVLGLTIGIATCLVIGLYVYDESTYDRFHTNGDRIYRINQPMIWGDWNEQFASTGPGVGEALRADVPEFEQVTRILALGERTMRVTVDGKATLFAEKKFFIGEDNFLKVFSFPFVHGDPATALKENNSMVITESTAIRYFGTGNAIGKLIELKNLDGTYEPYVVKGVVADLPTKSHLQFDILASLSTVEDMKVNSWKWIWTGFGTYGLVRENTDIAALTAKLQTLPPKWAATTTERIFNQSFNDYLAGKSWTLYLQPLRDIYLAGAPAHHRFGPSGNPQFVFIFGVIGALVLALSCINFMNLSTARSGNRAKEVGIRKVLGSQKNTLVRQFIIESTLYVVVAAIAALLLVQISLSAFNNVAGKQLELLPHFLNPWFIGVIIVFILLLGVLAGSYPAFYLSAFQPVETLKGKVRQGFKRKGLRNGLVVFQFTVSITLIICTVFVQKQLSYSSNMNTGIVKDHVLQLHYMEQLGDGVDVLKAKLEANPAFTQVSRAHSLPPYVWEGDRYKAEGPDQPVIDMSYVRVDEQYLPLLGVEFLAGRNLDPANPSDKHKIILNEEAVRMLGWGSKDKWVDDSPIGKFVVQAFDKEEKLEVIGVVKDFNFNSVKEKILPLLVMHYLNDLHWSFGSGRSYLALRLNPAAVENSDDMQAIINSVKAEVLNIDASTIFQYSFMDEEYENTFRAERQMGVVLNLFTGLAVVIACLGLFGLAAFSAEQRLKELGIRKVMGAKVHQLVFLFSTEFTKLVLLAILIASPLAWYFSDYWLSNFAFRTSIDIWVFVIASVSALSIAALTISYQAISAANTNPVDTLRNE